MKTTVAVRVSVHVRWWLRLYLVAVSAWAHAFGMEPDMGKVERMVKRGLVVKADRA